MSDSWERSVAAAVMDGAEQAGAHVDRATNTIHVDDVDGFIRQSKEVRMSMSKLPKFEGRQPDAMSLNVTGAVELEGPLQVASKLDDTTYAVVQLSTTKVAHNTDKEGTVHRVETLKVESIGIFDGTDEPAEIITRLHREARERAGISELPLS